ncbi:hypothetical protein G6F50_018349 [Rhizopus delemar]|uniref:Uncharacterized protein n=1 Tax=Rhizopus delemar TaxID=936053 RepID=A0A9P6XMQ1_9FUNG|nr:hypothetical protein G6F50_018349 [Rhizopus delemar]
MLAGPATTSPPAMSSRTNKGVSRQAPALYMLTTRRGVSAPSRVRDTEASPTRSPPPVASTEMVSTTSSRLGIRKE